MLFIELLSVSTSLQLQLLFILLLGRSLWKSNINRISKSSHWMCSVKKVFLNISKKIHRKTLVFKGTLMQI